MLLNDIIDFGKKRIEEIRMHESFCGSDRIYGFWEVRTGGMMLDEGIPADEAQMYDYVIDPSVATNIIIFDGIAGALHFMYEQLRDNHEESLEEGRNIDTHISDPMDAGRWRYVTSCRYWDFYPCHMATCIGNESEYEQINDPIQKFMKKQSQ